MKGDAKLPEMGNTRFDADEAELTGAQFGTAGADLEVESLHLHRTYWHLLRRRYILRAWTNTDHTSSLHGFGWLELQTKVQSLCRCRPSAYVHSVGQACFPYTSQRLQEAVTLMQQLAVAAEYEPTCWPCALHVHQAAVSASELLR